MMSEAKNAGYSVIVAVGGGAIHSIKHPLGQLSWFLRYGTQEEVRGACRSAASILDSFDYLLCGEITQTEAVRRLRILRDAREAVCPPNEKVEAPK